MNKKALNILLGVVLLAAVAAYLTAAAIYSKKQWSSVVCNQLQVEIVDSAENRFVQKHHIPAAFKASKQTYFGKQLSEISTLALEQSLLKDSGFIKQADVYATIDGVVHVKIRQRTPLVRIFADNGQNFYIDNEGYILQPSRGYTSDVPVVSGHIQSPFPKAFKGSMFDFFKKKSTCDSLYIQIFNFVRFIHAHPFWQAQVEQIYLTKQGKVELIPRVGAQIIRLGNLNDFEYKLHKLFTLYEKGMPLKGWNTYDMVDLSYSNQVVCRKR